MMRKPLALAIVLLIAALAPVSAIIGFCTRMPCCHHASSAQLASSAAADDCCTAITCYESPSAKLTDNISSADALQASPELVPAGIAPSSPPLVLRAVVQPSPPITTRGRLAILSTLLI